MIIGEYEGASYVNTIGLEIPNRSDLLISPSNTPSSLRFIRELNLHSHTGQPICMVLNEGLTRPQVDELVQYSNLDPIIVRFTSDPKRFGTLTAFREWRQKGRTVYSLSDPSEQSLLGIVWFGEEPLPTRAYTVEIDAFCYGITTAFRLYGSVRGQGLAHAVLEATFDEVFSSLAYSEIPNKGIWGETSTDNTPIRRAYQKFGFIPITMPNEFGKILIAESNGVYQ